MRLSTTIPLLVCLLAGPLALTAQQRYTYVVDSSYNPTDRGDGSDDYLQGDATRAQYAPDGKILLTVVGGQFARFRNQPLELLNRLQANTLFDAGFHSSVSPRQPTIANSPDFFNPIHRKVARAAGRYVLPDIDQANGQIFPFLGVTADGANIPAISGFSYPAVNAQNQGSGGAYQPHYLPTGELVLLIGRSYDPFFETLQTNEAVYFDSANGLPVYITAPAFQSVSQTSTRWDRDAAGALRRVTASSDAYYPFGRVVVNAFTTGSSSGTGQTDTLLRSAGTSGIDATVYLNVALQPAPQGKYLLSYYRYSTPNRVANAGPNGFFLRQYLSNGLPDPSFTTIFLPFETPDAANTYDASQNTYTATVILNDAGTEMLVHYRADVLDTAIRMVYPQTFMRRYTRNGQLLADYPLVNRYQLRAPVLGPQGQLLILQPMLRRFGDFYPAPEYLGMEIIQLDASGNRMPIGSNSGGFNGSVTDLRQRLGTTDVLAGGNFTQVNGSQTGSAVYLNQDGAAKPGTFYDGSAPLHVFPMKDGTAFAMGAQGEKVLYNGFGPVYTSLTRRLRSDFTFDSSGPAIVNGTVLADKSFVSQYADRSTAGCDPGFYGQYRSIFNPAGQLTNGPFCVGDHRTSLGKIFPRKDTSFFSEIGFMASSFLYLNAPNGNQMASFPSNAYDWVVSPSNYVLVRTDGNNTYKYVRTRSDLGQDTSFHSTLPGGQPVALMPDMSSFVLYTPNGQYNDSTLYRLLPSGRMDSSFVPFNLPTSLIAGALPTEDGEYLYIYGTFLRNVNGKPSSRVFRLKRKLLSAPVDTTQPCSLSIVLSSPAGSPGQEIGITGIGLSNVHTVMLSGKALFFRHVSDTQLFFTVPSISLQSDIVVISGLDANRCESRVSFTVLSATDVPMRAQAVAVCSGRYTDPQGSSAAYNNSQFITQTLTPSTPGAKLQLDLTMVQLSDNDQLYVYNGPNASSPLLFRSVGGSTAPGRLVSTNASGALTVRFYSNGAGQAEGFEATLSCLTGASTLPQVTALNPTRGVNGQKVTITGTNLTGTTTVRFDGRPAAFTVKSSIQVEATVPVGATTGYVSVETASGVAPSPGVFTVIDTARLFTGQTTLCSGLFTDPQGAEANYAPNLYLTQTLVPTGTGKRVALDFNQFDLASGDYLYIYNGTSASSPLLVNYRGGVTSLVPDTVRSTTGSLTVRFYSNTTDQGAGWLANIFCLNALVAPSPARLGGGSDGITVETFGFWPNPTAGKLTVRAENLVSSRLHVMDLRGRQVFQADLKEGLTELALPALTPGLYMVQCGRHTARLVIE